MELIREFLVLAVSAMLVENFVLVKFMGICPFLGVSKKIPTAVGMGVAVTAVITISSAFTWLVQYFLLTPFGLEYLQTIVFILVIASLVQFIEMFLMKKIPTLYEALGIYLPLITTNCAVLGAVILSVDNGYSFIESIAFGFASAVGFTLAIVIFAGVRMRVALANPPRIFKGTPIALITAGLIAMAFSGFSGMKF
jgi:electron transport complex protein RnfA